MLTDLLSLWLPILVATVGVFFASFVFWAATPWHKPDIRPVPDLARADAALESLNLEPGHYYIPCTHDSKEMKSEAFQERYKRGPWATINVIGAQPNMGKNLGLSFLVTLVISAGIAFLAGSVLAPGAGSMKVFQVTCTAGVLAYTFGGVLNGVWFGKPAGWVVRDIIDAAVYAIITGAAFALLWPGVPGGAPALPGA
ncbi:MAG: hypothetical protein LAT64_14045 [Phycisphaerales bacterium]|nr:hypothetical protein [Planctomycetota bacterium]MCH8509872.1 hypothetical protein [Phycisphaerales bacterium]